MVISIRIRGSGGEQDWAIDIAGISACGEPIMLLLRLRMMQVYWD